MIKIYLYIKIAIQFSTIAKAALLVSYIYLDLSIDARSDLKSDLSFFIKLSAPKSKLSKLS